MPLQDFWQFFCKSGKIPSGNDGCIGNSSCAVFRELAKHGAKMDILYPTTCIQHAVICLVHVLFLFTFLIFLVSSSSVPPGALSSTELLQSFEFTSILYNVTAVLSALVGMVNLSLGLYILVMGSIVPIHPWLHLIVQGASWITIAVSLRIRLRNQAKQIAYVWWIVTFFLASLAASLSIVDILRDATDFSPNVFVVIASWPVSCLLLACAIQGRKRIAVESEASISEPLLNGEHQNGGSETEDTAETESATASFLSRMTFQWLFPLLATGYKQPLQLKDIPHLDQKREAKTACDAFLNAWEEQKKKNPTKPQSVFQALLTVYWRALFVNGLCALGKVFALALGPIILLLFINYEAGERLFQYEGYVLVAALFFGKILESLFQRHWYAGARTIGMELRSGLVATIYQKQLR
jgi:ATP-binding cassette subfamily C (CFTR/MRP) protein 2